MLHAKDLLRALDAAAATPAKLDVEAIAREPWFIPETTTLKDQLNAFLAKKTHFALVVDEYGALQGLVTLEDILEEIVGEIEDEHDLSVQGVRPQPDGSVIVDGSVTIRDLNRAMDWDLPDDEAMTVAGLVDPRGADDPRGRPDLHLPRPPLPGPAQEPQPDHRAADHAARRARPEGGGIVRP